MSTLDKRFLQGLLAAALLAPVSVLADEEPAPFVPSNEEVDRELDRALEREYRSPPPASEPIPDYAAAEEEEEGARAFGARLRLLGAYWHPAITDLEFYRRVGTNPRQVVKIEDPYEVDLDGDDDLEGSPGGFYGLTLDLGRHVALRGGFAHATQLENDFQVGAVGGVQPFTYGDTSWGSGDVLELSHEVYLGDFDVVLRPLNNRYVTIDLSLGARYLSWEVELTRNLAARPQERERLEAVVPTVGFGLALRPVQALELFASTRVGHLSYEVDAGWRWDDWNDKWEYQERKERESTSVQVDLGLSLTIADTLGVIVGYRYEFIALERDTDAEGKGLEGAVHGLFAGVILQFSD
ncbi:MAG: hypothetical protein D6731_13895 [Planctomycetota bacterium]|nr:MAG: hypothetical protein D6731_13895 [Planctomycetota bacterium]